MKSILIIGLGRFGQHLCMNLSRLENEIMIIDADEVKVESMMPYVTSGKIADCTNEGVLESLGVRNFDLCFVCIGTNFQSSLEITSLVKDLGGKRVISKANRDIHAKFLLRNGADEVIYPDRDLAEKMAYRYSADNLFNYTELVDGYNIYEIPPVNSWVNKSIRESGIAAKYRLNIIGIKRPEETLIAPRADYIIRKDDHLIVVGHDEDIEKVLRKLS